MALKAGKHGVIYIAQYDLTTYFTRAKASLKRAYADVTAGGAAGKAWCPLLHEDTLDLEMLFDPDTGGPHTMLSALRVKDVAASVLSIGLGGVLSDKALAGYGAFLEDYPLEIPIEDMIKVKGPFRFSEYARIGYVLQAKATKTTDGEGTIVNDGAASSAGAEAYLHVFSCGADDALIVKVQTDTVVGFTSPTDLITFSTAAGATSERKAVAGAVEQFVRVTWAGTPAYSASFAVIWCRL